MTSIESIFGKNYCISANSERGPRSENQDCFGWCHIKDGIITGTEKVGTIGEHSELFVAVVCDGMGGLKYGAVASDFVCHSFISAVVGSSFKDLKELFEQSKTLLADIEKQLCLEYPESGTTFVALFGLDGQWVVVHLGDSRAYFLEDSWKRTFDHSPVDELFRRDLISEDEVNDHPLKNVISKYVGGNFAKDLTYTPVRNMDKIVLCSDGAYAYVSVERFCELISKDINAEELSRIVLNEGCKDNVTVIIVKAD